MLYSKTPQKLVRHADETTITLEPQRFYVHTFWRYSSTAPARSEGQDLQDEKRCPKGSKITKHKVEILVTPETIEPQQLYIGRLKLSFNDVYSPAVSGTYLEQTSYQSAGSSPNNITNAISPHLYASSSGSDIIVAGADTDNQEIGGSGSGYGITEWKLDDNVKHWINLKKVTVFDQRPLMGERWQRVPSKVKRINDGTAYMMFFFNDSPRGATPADTQLTINLKEYWEEKAL